MNMTINEYRKYCKQKILQYKAEGLKPKPALERLNEHLLKKGLPTNEYSTIRNYYY